MTIRGGCMKQKYEIESMSISVYMLIKKFGGMLFGIHKHSLHIKLSGKLITIGHDISEGMHHIKLKEPLDFKDYDLRADTHVYLYNDILNIGPLAFVLSEASIKTFIPYEHNYQLDDEIEDLSHHLNHMIEKKISNHIIHKYNQVVMNLVFDHVNQFIENQSLEHAIKLLGLGPGLTPYGDDILVGYILGKNSIGHQIDWIDDLIDLADQKTNHLSAQNIKDTYEKMYPMIYIQMIEDIFIHKKIEHAKKLMEIGDTSGIGMLIGFLHGIKEGEHKNERL
jgi:hypothetical protein